MPNYVDDDFSLTTLKGKGGGGRKQTTKKNKKKDFDGIYSSKHIRMSQNKVNNSKNKSTGKTNVSKNDKK